VLGDSYVEAVQVPIKDKIQSIITDRLTDAGKKVETIALGFSGMGTANELLFYRNLGRKFKPDLVVLVFISNDFANNSPTLHGINEGWHPLKGPRFFYESDHLKQQVGVVPVNLDFQNHFMPVRKIEKPKEEPLPLDNVLAWSELYGMSRAIIKEFIGRDQKQALIDNYFTQRIKFLRQTPFFETKLEGWNYPEDLDMNSMFFAKEPLPQVFQEALQLTELSLSLFKKETQKDGAELLVLSGGFMVNHNIKKNWGRTIDPENMLKRLKAINQKLDIDTIDLIKIFNDKGTLKDTRWRYDSHWNRNGHQWSGEAVADFVLSKKWIP
jgi:hypothetical protein